MNSPTRFALLLGYGLAQGLAAWFALKPEIWLPGTDAYYLVLQAKFVARWGELKIHDGNPLPYLIAWIFRSGTGWEGAVKILSATLMGLLSISVTFPFALAKGRAARLMALGLPFILPSLIWYHVLEFPKLSAALVFIPWWSPFFPRATERLVLALVSTLLAAAIHPASLVLSLCLLLSAWSTGTSGVEPSRGKWRGPSALLLIILIASGAFWRLQSRMAFPLTPSLPGLLQLAMRDELPVFLRLQALILFAGLILFLIHATRQRRFFIMTGLLLCAACFLIPSQASELFGFGERLAFLCAVGVLPFGAAVLGNGTGASSLPNRLVPALILATAFSFSAWVIERRILAGQVPRAANREMETIVAYVKRQAPEILIASRPLKFFHTARTEQDAFFFEPEPQWDKTRIGRVVLDLSLDELAYYLRGEAEWALLKSIPDSSALYLREDLWVKLRARIPREEVPGLFQRAWNHDRNPCRPRPNFLKERLEHGGKRAASSFETHFPALNSWNPGALGR